jgi:cardiolipin synthase
MPDGRLITRPAAAGLLSLPNIITMGRLCAVPMAVWLVLRGEFLPAFWLFAAAGASDALDGYLARRMGTSRLGAMLDPAADKALLVSMYVTLAGVHVLPDWMAILVVFRDVIIVGGLIVLWITGHDVPIKPLAVSKVNTVLQIVLVGAALLLVGYGIDLGAGFLMLVWLVAATTLASGSAYVWQAARP